MEITKDTIKDLDRRIKGTDNLKQKTFLMATRNRYIKLLGINQINKGGKYEA